MNQGVALHCEPLTLNSQIMELYHHRDLIGSPSAFLKGNKII